MQFCDLSKKKIMVTGASSGLGRATCLTLDSLGATVCLIGRDDKRLSETLDQMDKKNHIAIQFDLRHFTEYKNKFQYIVEHIGKIDGLIHFAGIRKTIPLKVLKIDSLHELIEINLYSFIELVKHVSKKAFVSGDGASVVVASSVLALRGAKALTGYGSSKAAVDGAVRSLACELAPKNIRINSICPGHVETEMNLEVKKTLSDDAYNQIVKSHPLGIGQPDDVANLAAFLVSDESRWITGATIPIDGGFTARS